MNILYLCDEYPPGRHGGIGTMVQTVAREMVQQGHRVIVAGFYDWGYGEEDTFEDEGVKVYRFRRGLSSSFFAGHDSLAVRAVNKLFKMSGIWQRDIHKSLLKYKAFIEQLVQQYHIDLIEMPDYNDYMRFCNSYVPFPKLPGPIVVKMHGCMTYIARENGQEVPQHIWQMEHDILAQATAVCSVSKYNAAKTCAYLDSKREVTVLYNGMHIPVLPQTDREDNTVVFTGSLSENKGVYQLMKAWNIVYEQRPDARLLVFGKGPVEKVSAVLDTHTRGSVQFRNHVSRDELFTWLARARIGVFPSYTETFGLAALEAMMCGAAVIFTKRSVGPELIEDGRTGLLTDPANEKDIAEKIILLLKDQKLRDEIAKEGRSKVLAQFDITILIKEYIVFYHKVLDSNKLKP